MQTLWQDVRYGFRRLLKNPGFTIVAVITLALGIGANTAIFSVVNAALLRPLPYAQADQLMMVFSRNNQQRRNWVAYPDLQDWRRQSQLFSEFSAFTSQSVNFTGRDEPARLIGSFVSANFFKLLQVEIAQGRGFQPREDEPGAAAVAVLSYGLWRDRFGGDPKMLGQSLNLNGQPFTIVGVLPPDFQFSWGAAEVWMPFQTYPNFSLERGTASAAVLGRLKPGVTVEQAQTEMETISKRLAEAYPATNENRSAVVMPFQSVLVEDSRTALLVLLGAVGFVLLIACANVANLMLARAVTRQKEMALRAALGASRLRLARQLLTETLLLSLLGAALGLLIGRWSISALAANSPANLPSTVNINLDWTVLGFTLAVAVLTGIVFGLAPALRFSRPNVHDALKQGGKTSNAGSGRNRLRGALVITQVALALALLIGSGLMIRSFLKLSGVNPGFNPKNLLTMEYRVPRSKYPESYQQWDFHRQVVERVRALPGVQSAAVVLALPHSGNGGSTIFFPLDRPEAPKGQEPRALRNLADTYYFQTMQIPLLRGRVFTDQDGAEAPLSVVINQTFANRYWPNENPVGKQLRFPENNSVGSIVGVVGDVKHGSLDEPDAPQLYVPFAQRPFIFATLIARTQTEPLSLANAVRGAVWSVDKDQPVWKVRTMEFLLDRSANQNSFVIMLLGAFSALALLLAAVGIYGVISYSVSQRTQEIGVRLALGAQKNDIYKLVVGQGLLLTLLGVAAGLLASWGLTRFLSDLLFGVSPTDAPTFAGISLSLIAVALLASYLPARRAMKVDPLIALRAE
jgi:putative ABC transport system permease protein